MHTLLTDALPAKTRQTLYLAFAVVGLALGAAQVGLSAAGHPLPAWLTVTLAVFSFLSTGLGLTAASNVRTAADAPATAGAVAGPAPDPAV